MLTPSVPFRSNLYLFKLFALLSEFFLINLSCRFSYFLRYNEFGPYEDYYVSFFLIFSLGWLGITLSNNGYDPMNFTSLKGLLRNLSTSLALHIFLILFYIVSAKAQYLSRYYLILTYSSSLLTVVTFRALLLLGYQYYTSINFHVRRVVLVGDQPIIRQMRKFFGDNQTQVYHFIRNTDESMTAEEKSTYIRSTVDEIKEYCLANQINELYFSMTLASEEIIDELTDFADAHFLYLRIVTDLDPLRRKRFSVDFVGPFPTLSLRQEPLKLLYNRMLKRAFDIMFSAMVILFIFPIILPIIAIAIKLTSPGPVFFRQIRSGRNNKQFICYKFRTMYVEASHQPPSQAVQGDPRVTRAGAFLRKTSLDELPQFFNVLLGDMSVVGPRPHAVQHTEAYAQTIPKFLLRHFVLPGITGHAQVNGFRGETENPKHMEMRVDYDAWYIENWSLLLDLKIILQTVWIMIRGQESAY